MASRSTPILRNISQGNQASDAVAEETRKHVPTTQTSSNISIWYKAVLLVCMSFNNASITLLIYYTRNKTEGPRYISSSLVFMTEVIKLLISVVILVYQSKSFPKFLNILYDELVCHPIELLKVSVPAFLYAIQNRFVYLALQYLDPATYQVSLQLKILTTAVLMNVVLGKKLSVLQWFSLVLLFFGVVTVHIKPEVLSQYENKPSWDYFVGLVIVVICCFCSSLAGVYFEKILKDSKCSFWVRNIEMYVWGIVTVGGSIMIKDYDSIKSLGFFHGYTWCVWILIGVSSLGGMSASLLIKYLDNNFKSLGVAGGILVSGYGSFAIFKNEFYIQFFGGSVCVLMAIFLFITK